jgi:hypothetical protein
MHYIQVGVIQASGEEGVATLIGPPHSHRQSPIHHKHKSDPVAWAELDRALS